MKTALLLAAAILLGSGPLSHSQAPTADPAARLLLLKTTNDAIIAKQANTLKALEQMLKDAQLLKTLGKRN